MELAPYKEQEWQSYQEKNQDGYGAGVIDYAERWAELMEAEINARREQHSVETTLKDHANRLSHEADTDGITGFMYGAAVHTLSEVWLYGEELRRWHNREYDDGGEGTVNPAIMTVRVPSVPEDEVPVSN